MVCKLEWGQKVDMVWTKKTQGQVTFQGSIHNAPGLTVGCAEQILVKESPGNWLYLLKFLLLSNPGGIHYFLNYYY